MNGIGLERDGATEAPTSLRGGAAVHSAESNPPSERDQSPVSLSGKQVGRYRLTLPIAVGGMAQVWAARPEGGGLSRPVAIKLVRKEYAADEEYSRMFIDEAMVASAIHHPNVCEVYDLGREGELLYMVLDWVPGDSLSGVLQTSDGIRPLDYAVAVRIIADACGGLHAAHEAVGGDGQLLGIVHRDISPPNILISVHGNVKVSDFGIAKARNQLHARTRTGQIKGKIAYLSPEQVVGGKVDRRADIYGMGCVLYLATVGLRPFGTGPSAMPKIVNGRFHRPTKVRANYPPELESIVLRALARDPQDRFTTADAFRIALERWMIDSGSVATSGDVAACVEERMKPVQRELIQNIMAPTRSVPDPLAFELLAAQERSATPTATSETLARRADLGDSILPPDDEATRVAKPRASAAPAVNTLRPERRLPSIDPPEPTRTSMSSAVRAFRRRSGSKALAVLLSCLIAVAAYWLLR